MLEMSYVATLSVSSPVDDGHQLSLSRRVGLRRNERNPYRSIFFQPSKLASQSSLPVCEGAMSTGVVRK